METLTSLQGAIATGAERVGPSVVGLGRGWGLGSGVVIGEGRVLTNAHNLRRDQVAVVFADGRKEQAEIAASDPDLDLAVLEVDTGDAPPIAWEPGDAPPIGTPVLALANPGGRGLRVTMGFVASEGRSFRGPRGRRISVSIEHTAPLLPGSSGGPVVDREGRLVGINTNRLGEGFYLAIVADSSLQARVDSLGRGEAPQSRRLGIAVAPAHVARGMRRAVGLEEIDGLLVRAVEDDGPAGRAGVMQGDLIVAADGRPIASADDLFEALAGATDSPLELKLVRGSDERTVTVTPEGSEQ
jgi:serine protease Do